MALVGLVEGFLDHVFLQLDVGLLEGLHVLLKLPLAPFVSLIHLLDLTLKDRQKLLQHRL